ncbi:MAG: DHH family phosphoesterase [Methylophaga sp.]|nr:DHH family phosphoesterase [Methylophaga sp.]
MKYFDVFNGDADGICSLLQLRLAEPRDATLITGVKRDIALLKNLKVAAGDSVTVLDISMQKNTVDLQRLLDEGAEVFYVDHHQAGDIPQHPGLTAHIDLDATACTALIVDNLLEQRFHLWAITAAFGDNLTEVAEKLARQEGLTHSQMFTLKQLGIALNYNGYGSAIDDLFYHPADLYRECVSFESPLDFVDEKSQIFSTLKEGYQQDMDAAQQAPFIYQNDKIAVLNLPAEKWARRVGGVFGNEMANRYPDRAHAILTPINDSAYVVSIRAPLNNRHGAGDVAAQFATGGGRAGAAGINVLPENAVAQLIDALKQQYQ